MGEQVKYYHMHIRVPELGLQIHLGQKNFRVDRMMEDYAAASWAFLAGSFLLASELPVKEAMMVSNNTSLPSVNGWFIIGIQKHEAMEIIQKQGINGFIYGEKNRIPEIILRPLDEM